MSLWEEQDCMPSCTTHGKKLELLELCIVRAMSIYKTVNEVRAGRLEIEGEASVSSQYTNAGLG